ncbi:MAG: hypothetical protein N2510_03520 [Ignavibacteria bacterium]|nr:hypothetical protein [Ignavibacteria bacterium]
MREKLIKDKSVLNNYQKTGIFLVSLSMLLLEFTLIRTLSVTLWYHFAFMIISISLLGLGISAITIILSEKINKAEINTFLLITSLLYSISIIFSFTIINKIPFDPFSLLVDTSQFFYIPLYFTVTALPFFLGGIIIGKLFTHYKKNINELYFYDLLGAGLSCFVFVSVLPVFGGSGGIIFSSISACLATISFYFKAAKFRTASLFTVFVVLVINFLFLTDPEYYLPIRVSPNKIYGTYLQANPELRLLTKWNSFSKVDVMKDDEPPVDDYPVYTAIIDAGNSTTNIPKVPVLTDSSRPPFDASLLAMILKREDSAKVFILGSGGGGEILTALTNNAKSVTAVEINPILNDLIEKDLAHYWTTAIAKDKRVKIITDDARGWLRGKRIKYDVIISAHTISASATNSGAMSLVENYILTEEALREYLQHLDINGILYITRPEAQIPRLVTTIKSAQKKNGGSDLKNQFFIFKRPPSEFEKDVSYLSGVIFRKSGFDEYDIQRLKTMSSLLNLETIWDPTSKQEGIFNEIIQANDLDSVYSKYRNLKLEPATDNNPYFEHFTDFTSLTLNDIKDAFSQTDRAIIAIANKPVAESTLIILLINTIILTLIFIVLPVYFKFRKLTNDTTKKTKYVIYFACLGLGYIMIEILLIQKFTLLLGQPVYTMLTVISTMLIFSGIGSLFSHKIIGLLKNRVLFIFIPIALLSILVAFFSDILFLKLARAELTWKILSAIAVIAPLAFLMGIPFPYGINKIPGSRRDITAYAWGINGFFSVTGSILAVILSMSYGFKTVFILCSLIYLGAMITLGKMESSEPVFE